MKEYRYLIASIICLGTVSMVGCSKNVGSIEENTSASQPDIPKKILESFVELSAINQGIILDIGAGTGKLTTKISNMIPHKEILALEPSKFMRIAFMARLSEHKELQKKITILPINLEQYNFEDDISGVLCMGVLGHLTKEERESLWETFEKKLKTGTPVLIGVLNKKFLSVHIGTPISIAQQDKNRYETFIKEINCNNKKKCEWVISYRISYKNKVIREITCPMNWNYESEEAVLKELSYANFRCVKVSDTLLFARKK